MVIIYSNGWTKTQVVRKNSGGETFLGKVVEMGRNYVKRHGSLKVGPPHATRKQCATMTRNSLNTENVRYF